MYRHIFITTLLLLVITLNSWSFPGGPLPPPTEPLPLPIDCVLSEWVEWQGYTEWDCYNTTKTRQEIRYKTILTQPANGGLACGPMSEIRTVTDVCEYTLNLDDNLFRVNTTSDTCYAEIPQFIKIGVGAHAIPQGSTCYDGVSSSYHDLYESDFLGSCNSSNMVNVSGGYCLDVGIYSTGGILGNCCSINYPWGNCSSGGLYYTCEEMFDYARSFHPEQRPSEYDRLLNKVYIGEIEYKWNTMTYLFRLYAEDTCRDGIYITRSNDAVVAGSLNQETYSFYREYHGQISTQETASQKYVYVDYDYYYRGIVPSVFTRSDLVNDNDDKYGWTQLIHTVQGTGCSYDTWLFAGPPDYWSECSEGQSVGSSCFFITSQGGYAYTCDDLSANKIGVGFVASDRIDYYDIAYTEPGFFQIYRYPVDVNGFPAGPIEFVSEQSPILGYVSSSGPAYLNLEKGYKYRVRTTVTDIVYSFEFDDWMCSKENMSVLNGNFEVINSHFTGGQSHLPNGVWRGEIWGR